MLNFRKIKNLFEISFLKFKLSLCKYNYKQSECDLYLQTKQRRCPQKALQNEDDLITS
jgi:hypothetical protein